MHLWNVQVCGAGVFLLWNSFILLFRDLLEKKHWLCDHLLLTNIIKEESKERRIWKTPSCGCGLRSKVTVLFCRRVTRVQSKPNLLLTFKRGGFLSPLHASQSMSVFCILPFWTRPLPTHPLVLGWNICKKIADLQAHIALQCDALWACRSAIFK